mgnify:CR=1 FL=1
MSSPLTKAPPEQWLGTLRNTPGVKPEEIERLGLPQWLRAAGAAACRQGHDGATICRQSQ